MNFLDREGNLSRKFTKFKRNFLKIETGHRKDRAIPVAGKSDYLQGGTKGWTPHSSGKYTWYQMRKDRTV